MAYFINVLQFSALVSGGVEVGHTNATTVNMSALQHAAVAAATTSTHQSMSIPTPVGLVSSGASIVQTTGLPIPHHVKVGFLLQYLSVLIDQVDKVTWGEYFMCIISKLNFIMRS